MAGGNDDDRTGYMGARRSRLGALPLPPMTQGDLFDSPYPDGLPAHVKEETSAAAARDVKGKAQAIRRRVYNYILSQGEHGSTDDEMQYHFYPDGAKGSVFGSLKARRRELQLIGLVVKTGRVRKSSSNKNVIVWKAVPEQEAVPLEKEDPFTTGYIAGYKDALSGVTPKFNIPHVRP